MRNIVSPLEGIRSPFGPRYGGFSPASLFAAGEQGVWYDPSDFSTLYQDAAGTTPVTAVEQPVGRILDKSGRGNHATQSTTASRPVLSARVNLLTYSEQFDNAAWNKSALNTTGTPAWVNVQTAPDGTLTADNLIENTAAAQHYVSRTATVVSGVTYTLSFYLKAGERTWTFLEFYGGIPAGTVYVNLSTGAKGTTTGSASAVTVTDNGDGWWRVVLPGFVASSTTAAFAVYNSTGNGVTTYTGDGTSGIYIWGADLRPTNQTTLLPAYQRIAAATDYDTTGFPFYLRFDGTDDSMATGTITPGIDKAQVFAGVRKQSDALAGIVAELSSSLNANPGTFYLLGPRANGQTDYNFTSKGTLFVEATGVGFVAPITNVVTGLGDISGDRVTLRANGTQVAQSTTDQGTGNYLAYPLYIGRRGGASNAFNGNIYSLIVRFGSNLDATTISNTETWVNGKTLAY